MRRRSSCSSAITEDLLQHVFYKDQSSERSELIIQSSSRPVWTFRTRALKTGVSCWSRWRNGRENCAIHERKRLSKRCRRKWRINGLKDRRLRLRRGLHILLKARSASRRNAVPSVVLIGDRRRSAPARLLQ